MFPTGSRSQTGHTAHLIGYSVGLSLICVITLCGGVSCPAIKAAWTLAFMSISEYGLSLSVLKALLSSNFRTNEDLIYTVFLSVEVNSYSILKLLKFNVIE